MAEKAQDREHEDRYAFKEFVNLLVRPERKQYTVEQLGPKSFVVEGRQCSRVDCQLTNARNQRLEASHWLPFADVSQAEGAPCVLYLHDNTSCRLEAINLLTLLLPYGFSVFSLDFSGCGLSDGDVVSCGFHEKDDIVAAVKHLESAGTGGIALWGRGMGAVAALHYESTRENHTTICMILDGAYSNLMTLAREIAEEEKIELPNFMIKMAIKKLSWAVKDKANFVMQKMKPIKFVENLEVPALFIHGKDDHAIQLHHAQELYDAYKGGDKRLLIVEGRHKSARPVSCFDAISAFLHETFYLKCAVREMSPKAQKAGTVFLCEDATGYFKAGSSRLVLVLVSEFGVRLLAPFIETAILQLPMPRLKAWNHNDYAFMLQYVGNEKVEVMLTVKTGQGQAIAAAIQNQIQALLVKRGGDAGQPLTITPATSASTVTPPPDKKKKGSRSK